MDVEHTQKMIPLISRETCFGQNVCELVSGVNMFDLDLGFQVYSVKQPIKTLWVLGHMSHHHFDHGFVVFKDAAETLLEKNVFGATESSPADLGPPLSPSWARPSLARPSCAE